MRIKILLVILLSVCFSLAISLGGGCKSATPVEENEDDEGDDDAVDDDDDDDSTDTEPPAPPVIDTDLVRSTTGLDYQSIHGTTEPGAFVLIKGGASQMGDSAYADMNSGEFCIVVELILNATNILEITAEDAAGNRSDPTNVAIVQVRNNVCLTGTAEAASVSHSEPIRTPDQAIDGSLNTYWANTTQFWYPEANREPQWFRVGLADHETINRIDVYWSEDAWGTEFSVWYSNADEKPVDPHVADSNYEQVYTLISEQTNPDTGFDRHNRYDMEEPIVAKWLLLTFNKSTQKNALLYKYQLVELDAYSLQTNEEDPGCD